MNISELNESWLLFVFLLKNLLYKYCLAYMNEQINTINRIVMKVKHIKLMP